ncbi:MAG TPA: glycosyltransferase [Gaiellaceae bacterium]|nr:glycosyltransferase [Gaiellaceae bacterium]
MRLGIYVDDVYRVVARPDGAEVSVDRAFLLFACEIGRRFERLVLFGRTMRTSVPADYVLPREVELAALPHYSNLRRLSEVGRSLGGTVAGMWHGLSRVDCVWIFGPHPFALVLAALAAVRRKRVVLGVRMDSVRYYGARLRSRRWLPALIPIVAIDAAYRLLARRLPTTVVGADLARRYGHGRPRVLTMIVSLVPAGDVLDEPPTRDWSHTIELVTVGRIEPEKNPRLLLEALHRLDAEQPGRFRLTWAGRGDLEEEVRATASELGLDERLELAGYVPFGPRLLELYRSAHVFVHVSVTEGVPQVLVEALASGTVVVATEVGGVADLLDGGRAGLVVAPGDVDALVTAIRRASDDERLRASLVERGLAVARTLTLEEQAARVARFLAAPDDAVA